jgi:hypothetical protein
MRIDDLDAQLIEAHAVKLRQASQLEPKALGVVFIELEHDLDGLLVVGWQGFFQDDTCSRRRRGAAAGLDPPPSG